MIVFDLRCAAGHVFEAWFGSSGDFEDQRTRALISCPLCGDGSIEKAVMAPNVAAKGNRQGDARDLPISLPVKDGIRGPAEMKAMLGALAKAQAAILENSQWVGKGFADKARAMHLGEVDHAPIHGQVSPDQATSLIEDGVPVAPLPFPVVPPEAQN